MLSHPRPRFAALLNALMVVSAAGVLALAGPLYAQCVGNCNNDTEVTIDELLVMVNIANGAAPFTRCEAGDGNDDGDITIDDILVAVNNSLNGCTAAVTPTPTATTTTPAPACAQPTPQSTPPPPTGCGNRQFDVGETCDDGNNTEDDITIGTAVDRCPYNCRISSCAGAQSMQTIDVNLCIPTGAEVVGATILVRYPDTQTGIPGSGGSDLVFNRILNILEDPFVSITPNDLDYSLRSVAFSVDLAPLPAGRLFSVQFDVCPGQTAPTAADFRCFVKDASDASGASVSGVGCTVSIP